MVPEPAVKLVGRLVYTVVRFPTVEAGDQPDHLLPPDAMLANELVVTDADISISCPDDPVQVKKKWLL